MALNPRSNLNPKYVQAMGRRVLVFNCDEEFDFKAMGRIFVGLVKCGAWGCFDEFNRLDEEVLSAVSQQIQIIQVGGWAQCWAGACTHWWVGTGGWQAVQPS